ITLTAEERKRFGHVCIERSCQYLGGRGSTLNKTKPFSCKLYPLAYDPRTRDFYYDTDCPLMPDYMSQLGDPQSEASQHLAGVQKEVFELERREPLFTQ